MPAALTRSIRVGLVLLALSVSVVLPAPQASAHTELRASTPEQGSTVDELTEVRLEFSGALLDIGAELAIEDADGASHALVPEFPEDTVVTAPVDAAVAAGETTLVWRIVAEDGHPIEGTVTFTYAPEPVAPAEPTTEPSDTAVPEPSASAVVTPSASPSAVLLDAPATAEPEPATPGWVWPVIGVAALGAAAAAVIAAVRRRG
ncbi:copper resistance protein CopC [Demequina sp. NBRC 110056]|uniref:copper resistance CopC family protein n=1 Tax=Demequina sp. NBRC 110056 TaxID=1570345 RepID=UPI000A0467EF|nr:copper resistance protein CopC [Demequina sp. NBRC 110056]